MRIRPFLFLLLVSVSAVVHADTIWMTNGDRLTGSLVFFDGGKLVLKTDYAGEIALEWKNVATLESGSARLITELRRVEPYAATLRSAPSGTVVVEENGKDRVVSLSDIARVIPPSPVVKDFTWRGGIDIGVDLRRGDYDWSDYDLAASFKSRHGPWQHMLGGSYLHEEREGTTRSNRWRGQYLLDHFIDSHWIWNTRVKFRRDTIKDARRWFTVGTGPAYQFWDVPTGSLKIGALISASDLHFADGAEEQPTLIVLRWDYNRFFLGKALEFYTQGEAGTALSGNVDYLLDGEIGLRYRITDWASVNLKAEHDTVNARGTQQYPNDARYVIGLGFNW